MTKKEKDFLEFYEKQEKEKYNPAYELAKCDDALTMAIDDRLKVAMAKDYERGL